MEARVRRAVGEVRLLGRDLEREEVLGVVAGIDRAELAEAAHQEPRSDQEDERHRGLRHHQPVARPVPAPRGAASAVAQSVDRGERGAHRRQQAAEQRREHGGAEREEERSCSETATWSSRGTLGGAARSSSGTLAHASTSATRARERRHHGRLGELDADQVAAGRAQRPAHGEIALAPLEADHEQVRDVGAGDEEDDRRRAEQHPQRRRDGADGSRSSSGSTIGRCCSIRRA